MGTRALPVIGNAAAWLAALVGVAALAAFLTLVAYVASPAIALALPLGLTLTAAIFWRPIYGVYAGFLAVPLELYSIRLGGEAGLSGAEFLLLLAAVATAARLLFTRERAQLHAPQIAFLALVAISLLGVFVAEDTFVVWKVVVMWSAFALLSVLVAGSDLQALRNIMTCLAISGGICGLIAVLGGGPQELVAGGALATNRAQGTFSGPNVLAFYLLMTLPPALVMSFQARPLLRPVMAACAGLAIAALLLTLSRGSIIGAMVALAVLLAYAPFRRVAIGLLVVVLVFGAFNVGAIERSRQVELVGKRLASVSSSAREGTNPRFQIWRTTQEIIANYPWLGIGQGNFSAISPRYGLRDVGGPAYDHAHNVPLNIAVETGIGGLALLLLLVVLVARACRRALRVRAGPFYPLALAATAMLAAIATAGLTDFPLRVNPVLAAIMVAIGVVIAVERLGRDSVQASGPTSVAALRGSAES